MNEIEKLLTIARAEIGYHEQGENFTKYAAELDETDFYNGRKDGHPWCDIYVDWVFFKAFGHDRALQLLCQPAGGCGAGCSFSAGYYSRAGRWSKDPEPGAQIFFYAGQDIGHTGIVEKVEGGKVVTIEGNTSDMVARRTYSLGDPVIAGYGVPAFRDDEGTDAESESDTAPELGEDPPDPAVRYIGTLERGDFGDDVRLLQALLRFWGFPAGSIDGEYGRNTAGAVSRFQSALGLEVDGIAGPQTFGALLKIETC